MNKNSRISKMTEQQLIEYGYKPKECKIGTLYFKNDWFCRFKDFNSDSNIIEFFYNSSDTVCRGTASTIKELKDLEKNYFISLKDYYTQLVSIYSKIIDEYDD